MFSSHLMKKGTLALGLLLSACTSGAPPAAASGIKNLGGAIVDRGPVSGGTFEDGRQLGLRNGTILVDRLKKRTVDVSGCDAIDELQAALLKVSASLKTPLRGSDAVVAGFYSGYLEAIRESLDDVRNSCGVGGYTDGSFAGSLVGEVACQVESISVTAVSSLQLQPLYAGWSGGLSSVQESCRTSLTATLKACTDGADLLASIVATASVSCTDSSVP